MKFELLFHALQELQLLQELQELQLLQESPITPQFEQVPPF